MARQGWARQAWLAESGRGLPRLVVAQYGRHGKASRGEVLYVKLRLVMVRQGRRVGASWGKVVYVLAWQG